MPQHVVDSGSVDTSVTMADPALITHDDVAEVFNDALRRRVGRGVGKVSVPELADRIDMDARTVRAWRDDENVPQFHAMMRLFAALGPAFTSEVLAPAGQGGVELVEPATVDAIGTAAFMSRIVAALIERLSDEKFCHQDCAVTGPELLELSRLAESQGRAMMSTIK